MIALPLKKLWGQSFISFAIKSITIAVTLILTKVIIEKIGVDSYGQWAAYYSVITWGILFDLGIGSVIINKIKVGRGINLYILLSAVAIYSFVILFFLISYIIFSESNDDFRLMLMLLVMMPLLTIVDKYYIARLVPYRVELVQFIITLLFLLFIICSTDIFLEDLILSFVFITITVRGIVLFYTLYLELRSSKKFHLSKIAYISRYLIRTGAIFFILQIFAIILISFERFIILKIYGGEETAAYDLISKVFLVVMVFGNIFARNLWGVVANSNKSELAFSLNLLIIKYFVVLIFIFFTMAMAVPFIIDIWVGISVPLSLSLVLGLWSLFQTYFVTSCNFMNGLQLHKTQLPFFIFCSILKFILIIAAWNKSLELNMYVGFSSLLLLPYVGYVVWFLIWKSRNDEQ
ncbi:hypothetical protein [Shewanella algae]|uniref:hypothetical protein n=1 Tax=Shewanella algae TaxID=38313 RepID=UPI001AAE0BD1|nr:hypothetical protein [Shewanella algae]MBO2564625.1 hypothetical protein [Shewanella algae]MBO2611445.1 hypothetical protein [Shewanella algae]UZD59936.1 hypothetical protein OLL83_001512 [Shewanella algae]